MLKENLFKCYRELKEASRKGEKKAIFKTYLHLSSVFVLYALTNI